MRLCLFLYSDPAEQRVPLSHLDLLREWLTALLPEDDGWVTYSDLRVPMTQRAIHPATNELSIAPGVLQWWLASPHDKRIREIADRLTAGEQWRLGSARFRVGTASLHAFPRKAVAGAGSGGGMRFTCWTPIIANGLTCSSPGNAGELHIYETQVCRSLLDKHEQIRGVRRETDRVRFRFDAGYLDRHPRAGSKRILWRGRPMSGMLAPFTLTAPPKILRTAWECGIGDRAEKGFGFAEIVP